ncbi:Methyltransferase domain-containing protein [Marinobacter sp. es.048]|uniref:methyltransferase n=1 Tax=Marinobacter sp. es.048 TaxID=1761795 RepID=UPI000B58E8E5|nr:methyltransferase [Marinobacter sp. es.048]SNC63045.1 Methyltransferase domain-containing protein [Marinobacter sp. es.048]
MTLPPAASLHHGAESFYQRWRQLNDWLVQHREFWQPAPFMTPEPAWTQTYPELNAMLAELTDAECQHLDDVPIELAARASRWLPSLEAYADMVQLPELLPLAEKASEATLPEIRATDMPGRKRLQSGAFTAALRPLEHPALDWCCGKGHLSRTLAPFCPGEVQGFEWNPELVQDGNRLAQQFGDRVLIGCQDVMAADLSLPKRHHCVALHACGDLHRQLLRRGSEAGLPRLSISPCCYHLSEMEPYRPLSEKAAGYQKVLQPSRNDLRLAVQETVTAPARVREQTRLVSQWRLGFDGLQRHLRGRDDYLPVPSHPARLLSEGFSSFCRWAAAKKNLELPGSVDFDAWLAFGERRLVEVRRHELVRHLFRRPLELWMVFDYALFLKEQGYTVRLGQFCDRSLTPRNLLLDAVRVSGTQPVQHSHP